MATSGNFTLNITSGVSLTYRWSRSSYSVNNITSTISWTLTTNNAISSLSTITYSINVNGTNYSGTATNKSAGATITSGNFTLTQSQGRTANFNVSLDATYKTNNIKIGSNSTSNSFEISIVPTPAKITYADDFTDETTSIAIMYSNYAGDLVDNLEACISFNGTNDDIAYRAITKTSNVYHFFLTNEERKILRQGITQGNSATIRFYVRTEINGTYYYSYLIRTCTLKNYTPTLNPSVRDTNARTLGLTGDSTKFIKYFSNASINTGGAARKEATIETQNILNGSQSIDIEDPTSNTAVINGVDSNTFYFMIRDSRGIETRDFKVVDLVDYVKLTSSLTLSPLTLNGALTLTFEGNYYNGSFSAASSNTLEFEYGLRENGGDISWHIIDISQGTFTLSGNTYRLTYTITGLNPDSTYTITSNVIDELMTIQTTEQSVIAKPVFSWSKNKFKHNTPVYLEKNKSIRTKDNEGNDISVLNPCNPQGALVLGWGQYDNANGDTSVYGNNINLTARESIKINGKPIGGKVLWSSTGWYMNASQVVNLTESISSQINGIVLVFSLYRDGAAEDASIHSFFVSKKVVELLPNAPHTFFMMINSGFSVIGAKYLYIDDTKITGHNTNSTSGTNNNMTFSNNSFVLRYVIGV